MGDADRFAYEAAEEEAAEWLVRLGDRRNDPALMAAFETWLAAAPENAAAFERLGAVWTGLGEAGRRWRGRRVAQGFAAACVAVVALVGAGLWMQDPVYQTGRGEQEQAVLDDGTRLTLNTDSRVQVRYSKDERHVVLARGEVFFDVRRNPDAPFVVEAGEDRVTVLGTSFVVRRGDDDRLEVALFSGSVLVAEGGPNGLSQAPIVLSPGERVRTGAGAARIDRPQLSTILAWRRGELVLDATPVGEAVAEMNRYSERQIVLDAPAVAHAPISGVFKTGDGDAFALTLSRLYNLERTRRGSDWVLTPRQG